MLQIARIIKSHGTEGEVIITLSPQFPEDIDLTEEPVFIVFDELPVPFFILSYESRGKNRMVIKLDDVDTIEYAEEIIGRDLYINTDNLATESSDDSDDMSELIGFTLFDTQGVKVGKITDIYDFSGNICLSISIERDSTEGKADIMIPFHEDLVVKIERKQRSVTIQIPDGLRE